MELKNLRELTGLLADRSPVIDDLVEARKSKASDFDGIKSVVDDALADLVDKLSAGGSLENLMDDLDITQLDSVKNSSGLTILESLDHLVTQFKADIESALTEAEILFMNAPINEGRLSEMSVITKIKIAGEKLGLNYPINTWAAVFIGGSDRKMKQLSIDLERFGFDSAATSYEENLSLYKKLEVSKADYGVLVHASL